MLILIIGVWFGLVTGLLEGVALVLAQELGWLSADAMQLGVAIEIVWISALFDLVLFGVVALGLLVVTRVAPGVPATRAAVWVFVFMAAADLAALTGRIQLYAVVLLASGVATAAVRWFDRRESAVVRFWQRSVAAAAAVAVVALVSIEGGLWLRERLAVARLPEAAPGSRDVLVIVIDTLRADHLSSYGYGRATSPNIDRLAREGVLFEHAFSSSSWTAPAHATLLTGHWQHEHQVGWRRGLDRRFPTLPEALRARGYRTAAFSANSDWFSRRLGFGRGFIRFEDYFFNPIDMAVRTVYGRTFAAWGLLTHLRIEERLPAGRKRRAGAINASTLAWIEEDPEKPFFAFLNYYDPHAPYMPPEPYRDRFAAQESSDSPDIDAYDGEIAFVDAHIGQLVEAIALQRGRPPLVVITSDHGESFGEHDFLLHANSLYMNEIHVPLIVWAPGVVPSGVRITDVVSNAAIAATVMDVVAPREPAIFPRPPLTRLWSLSDTSGEPHVVLSGIEQQPFGSEKQPVYHGGVHSIVTSEWHYMEHEKFGSELYAWRVDPNESDDLADRVDLRELVERFREQTGRSRP